MRDARSLILLLVSLLLVLVSFILLWTWGYRFYNKNDEFKVAAKVVITDSNALANRIRDSLQKVYNETLYKLDSRLDSTITNSDSLKRELDVKLSEFFRLSNEITAILNRRNNNYADFNIAGQKIGELQSKVEDLRDKNQVVDSGNRKLGELLEQEKRSDSGPQKPLRPVAPENNGSPERNNISQGYSVFTASEMKLSAIAVTDDRESETSMADETKKLVGAFTVTNNNSQLSSAEVVVVVQQPDGHILRNSEWESGSFNTPEGRKIYSYKLNFSYSKGEPKRLYFSLKADKYQKGSYSMQVYYNGTMIGRISKTLS